jgi:predicted phage terminase large subunit-like protein
MSRALRALLATRARLAQRRRHRESQRLDELWARRTWYVGDPNDPNPRRRPARPEQREPPLLIGETDQEWLTWLILAGRGWGKTRTGAEWTIDQIRAGLCRNFAIVGRSAADVRDVMIRGVSGILAVSPPEFMPVYQPSLRLLTWPNGAQAHTYSAEEPDSLRGPGHDGAWLDELAAWRYVDTYDQLMLGLREGARPRAVITTTPRPTKIIKDLLADPTVVVTRGTTYENLANLAPIFRRRILQRYEGTRLGRQELHAEVLDDLEGALWTQKIIDDLRVKRVPRDSDGAIMLARVVVAIDPATTSNPDSDETGIVVAGLGMDGDFYVLHADGYRLSPNGWARRALELYDHYQGDRIIAERNAGGEMVEATVRVLRPHAPLTTIVASRGKTVRAEPISALYVQKRVHHVGRLDRLETQMTSFPVDPSAGDDIVDALVFALTELDAEQAHPLDSMLGLGRSKGWQPAV